MIDVLVTFSEPVDVTNTPQIILEVGYPQYESDGRLRKWNGECSVTI